MTLVTNAESQRRYRERHPEKAAAHVLRWHAANQDRVRDIKRRYRERNREAIREQSRTYSHASYHADPVAYRERGRRWRSDNKALCLAFSAARKALKLRATPLWLTVERREQTAQMYVRAAAVSKFFGFPCDVDHIHPLRGKDRTGLHVPWNLQILPSQANKSKHNKAPEQFRVL